MFDIQFIFVLRGGKKEREYNKDRNYVIVAFSSLSKHFLLKIGLIQIFFLLLIY